MITIITETKKNLFYDIKKTAIDQSSQDT